MLSTISVLIGIIAIVFWWTNHAQARESALRWAKWGCGKRHCQLLDQAVAWRRIRLRRHAARWHLHWVFSFEYALGSSRHTGRVVVFGQQLQEIYFPSDIAAASPKVINLDDYR